MFVVDLFGFCFCFCGCWCILILVVIIVVFVLFVLVGCGGGGGGGVILFVVEFFCFVLFDEVSYFVGFVLNEWNDVVIDG